MCWGPPGRKEDVKTHDLKRMKQKAAENNVQLDPPGSPQAVKMHAKKRAEPEYTEKDVRFVPKVPQSVENMPRTQAKH